MRHYRKKVFLLISFGISILFLILLASCTIEEYTGPATGDLVVNTIDNQGNTIIGAHIYLDGLLRSEVTPDTLKNILSGSHSLRIEKYGYNVFEDSNVVVEAYTTSNYQVVLQISNMGVLSVDVTGGTGNVIVDGILLAGEAPGIFPDIPVGLHFISIFQSGYFTSPDTLIPVQIVWQETTSVNFGLTSGTVGGTVDDIAPDFTLLNDNLDSVSLHNYRGHVVMVTFWYST
jgi:hypothetical protein